MKKNKLTVLFVIGFLFVGTQFVIAQEEKKKVERVEAEIEVDDKKTMQIETKKETEVKAIKEKPVDVKTELEPNRLNGEGNNSKKEIEIIEEEDLEDDDDGKQKIIGKRVNE